MTNRLSELALLDCDQLLYLVSCVHLSCLCMYVPIYD